MAKEQWSAESIRLRAEAHEAIDKLNRSMDKDREEWGRYEDDDENLHDVRNKHLTAWVIISQYQGMEDPEASNALYATSGCTNATSKGLAHYAAEAF